MKKLLSVLVAVMMLFAFTSVAFAAVTDIAGHWAAADIQTLIDKGIVSGDDTGKFNPEGKVTREQYAKMVVLAKGLAVENPATATFTDVPKTAWSFGYVEAAVKAGLIKGIGDGKYAPAANITRQDVAVIVARALNLDTTGTPDFTDAASIASYAKGSVAAAAKAGIVKGFDGKFNPTANATRAEASVMTLRQVNYKAVITGDVVSKNLANSDLAIEIGGKLYDFATSYTLKFGGEFIEATVQDLFVKGTAVKYTLNNDDEIVILEGLPNLESGKLTSKGTNADGRTVEVNSKTLVYVKSADEKGKADIEYGDLAVNANYKFFIKDGKVYGAVETDAVSKVGKITAIGHTSDPDQYFLAIDGTKYFIKKDKTPSYLTSISINDVKAADGDAEVTAWNSLDTDYAAKVVLDGKGEIAEIYAFDAEITGSITSVLASTYVADYSNVDGDTKYAKNIIKIGNLAIGESAIESVYLAGTDYNTYTEFRVVSSSATVTIDGVSKDYEDLKADKYVKLTVNGEGVITAIEVTKGTVKGQVASWTENDSDEIDSITVGTTKYYVNDDETLVDNGSDALEDSDVVILELNTAGEIVNFTDADIIKLKKDADDEVISYAVTSTPFEKGRPTAAEVIANSSSDDTYAPANTIRVIDNETGLLVEITTDADTELIKAGQEIKFNAIKKGDSIGYQVDGGVATAIVVSPAN